jgi:hypothetical protein
MERQSLLKPLEHRLIPAAGALEMGPPLPRWQKQGGVEQRLFVWLRLAHRLKRRDVYP